MRVFISYTHYDANIANQLSSYLKSKDFEVFYDQMISAGSGWKKEIEKAINEADAMVALYSRNSMQSGSQNQEIGRALGKNIPLLPIIIDDAPIPFDLIDIQCLFVKTSDDLSKAFGQIEVAITARLEKRLQAKRESEAVTAKREKDFVKNIDGVCKELEDSVRRNKRLALVCYTLSVALLMASILVFYAMRHISANAALLEIGIVLASRVVVVALIVSVCRLFFVLGKSFMVESIRCADRRHAISFGKFFMDAYGDVATIDEIIKAFQAWNIDGGSSFRTQTTEEFDPKISELIKLYKSK